MKAVKEKREKLFNIYFFIIAFVNLGASTMMQMFNSTIALHIDGLEYTASVSGTIISIGAVSATIYRFFGGRLCQKSGRKRLIAAGLAVFGGMSFVLGLVESLPLIYIFRVVQMFGYSMVSTSVSVAVIDVIPQKRVGEGLGYYSLAASLPQAFGPSTALFLYHMDGGFFTVMTGLAVIGGVALVITLLFLNYESSDLHTNANKNAAAKESAEKGIWRYIEKRALPAAWVYFFISISGSLVTMYLTLYASKTGIANGGLFFSISVVFMIGARIVSGKLSDCKGVLFAVVPGTAALAGGYMLLIFSSYEPILFYIAGAFYGFGTGLASPALNAQAVKDVPKDRVSIASSTFFLPMDIAFMAGSVLWGVMIDFFSFSTVFGAAAGLCCAAMVLSFALFSTRKRKVIKEVVTQKI